MAPVMNSGFLRKEIKGKKSKKKEKIQRKREKLFSALMRSIKLSFGFVDMKTQMKWNRVKKRFDSRGGRESERGINCRWDRDSKVTGDRESDT